MALYLTIENETSLPDGGPLTYTASGAHRVDIGRNQYIDWTLPDPSLTVSGRHCEIHYQDGVFWLTDVSRNGTFVNQTTNRLQEPYRLRSGDRLYIGAYIIRVEIDGDGPRRAEPSEVHAAPAPPVDASPTHDPWALPHAGAAPPLPRHEIRAPLARRDPDYFDRPVDLPVLAERPDPRREAAAQPGPPPALDWSIPPVPPPPDPSRAEWPMPPIPSPVRGPAPPAPQPPPSPSPDDLWGAVSLQPHRSAEERPPARDRAESGTPSPAPARDPDAFIQAFARGAGISPEIVAWRDPEEFAEELGAVTRLAAENLKQLLAARMETKRLARASTHTMIQPFDNNPLKFTPTVEDALRIMLGRPTSGYLGARRSFEEGFRDAKGHQLKVFSAMQNALRLLLQGLDPETINASLGDDRGLGGLLGSRKARLWDAYATRWDTLTAAHEDGIVDAFMVYFSECYDRGDKDR